MFFADLCFKFDKPPAYGSQKAKYGLAKAVFAVNSANLRRAAASLIICTA
jgi:hypothetical protein